MVQTEWLKHSPVCRAWQLYEKILETHSCACNHGFFRGSLYIFTYFDSVRRALPFDAQMTILGSTVLPSESQAVAVAISGTAMIPSRFLRRARRRKQ